VSGRCANVGIAVGVKDGQAHGDIIEPCGRLLSRLVRSQGEAGCNFRMPLPWCFMLPEDAALVRQKVEDLIAELKLHGLWKTEAPCWVHSYAQRCSLGDVDFFEWLQFMYIPNKLYRDAREARPRVLVMPQARPFVTQPKEYAAVIRLMVELDGV
jgi:uncharacterized protein YqcC (DUF446 family)